MEGVIGNNYSGSIPVNKPHNVSFIGLEGEVVSDEFYSTDENAVVPSPPIYDYLEPVECTHTQEELSNLQYRSSERNELIPGDEICGFTYKTSDGKTHIFGETQTTVSANNTVALCFHKVGTNTPTININWGDGFTESFVLAAATAIKQRNFGVNREYHTEVWSNDNVPYGMGNGTSSTQVVTTGLASVKKIYFSDYTVLKPYCCYNMTNLEVVSLSAVQPIFGYSFSGCSRLKSLTIPRINTIFPNNLCTNCYTVKYIVIPPTITELGVFALSLCISADKIVLPRGINVIPANLCVTGATKNLVSDPIVSIGDNAFKACYLMAKLNLAKEITASGTSIMEAAYAITLNGLKVLFISNISNALHWVYQLYGKLEIDGTVPISINSLAGLHNCEEIVIGGNITTVTGVITNPECLIYEFKGLTPPTLSSVNNINGINKLAAIYVPDAAVETYKTATNWTGVANYIKPVSERL